MEFAAGGNIVGPVDGGQTGQTWTDGESFPKAGDILIWHHSAFCVFYDLTNSQAPRTDKAHLSPKDI